MRQIFQNLKNGAIEMMSVPVSSPGKEKVLIQTSFSLVSAGTERILVEFGQANLIDKARSQPDRVRQVLDKMRTDGLLPTLETVFARLDQPLPLGYCNAGVVQEVGAGVSRFAVGDRVVSNGPHAEIVQVPPNLCAHIPDNVSDEEAAFTVLAAVGLQGIRLAQPTIGESVVVIGLGLVGLLTTQMLIANGCRVLGLDFDANKCALACTFGAQALQVGNGTDPVSAALAFTNGRGVDAVLITASTKSSEPVHQAAQMCRKRGRILLVGVTGLELNRADFYEKELTFQVSCSYGPGRYDEVYEQQGHDYPLGFVRWTEQRNFEAVLDLMASGKLDVTPLISRKILFDQAPNAYAELLTDSSLLGILLEYNTEPVIGQPVIAVTTDARPVSISRPSAPVQVGVVGAGNFASLVLLPALSKTGANLHTIASRGGASAAIAARKFGFDFATADENAVLRDEKVNTLFVATRHNSHAPLVIAGLQAGKHVFVEKPLALNREQLDAIGEAAAQAPDQQLLVGFNRRFAPLVQQMKQLAVRRSEPISVIYTVNAGVIPANHWTHDPEAGGGRIIGEACHFIDLVRYLVGHPITGITAQMMGAAPAIRVREDKMSISLQFADGSTGVVHYFANGSKQFPKERVELFSEGRVLALDNFKHLTGYGWAGLRRQRSWRQDKGHQHEVQAFVDRIHNGGEWLIPWAELREVTLATFVAVEQAQRPLPPLR